MDHLNDLQSIRSLIIKMGDDPTREGLRDTPARVLRSYGELFSGYHDHPKNHLTTFEAENYSEMIVLKGIEFTSFCEHHLLPFLGVAHIAYIPNGRVVGISKLARVLEIYSRRLQIQERICEQVTQALIDHLDPLGAACVLEAKHLCMVCRGVQKQNSVMVTSSLKREFLENLEARQEFFSLIKD
jgi:GTP cyclohydrolase I